VQCVSLKVHSYRNGRDEPDCEQEQVTLVLGRRHAIAAVGAAVLAGCASYPQPAAAGNDLARSFLRPELSDEQASAILSTENSRSGGQVIH
jgi:hypothetical protein